MKLLINTCHRRGAHAMGGMAAQIPVKNNPKLAAEALESVRKDKVGTSEVPNPGFDQMPCGCSCDLYPPPPCQLARCFLRPQKCSDCTVVQGSTTWEYVDNCIKIRYFNPWTTVACPK